MNKAASRVNRWIDERICQIEPNIVGRFGLFRILYATFYLWVISHYDFPALAHIPVGEWQPLLTFTWMTKPLGMTTLQVLQLVLVASLVLVLVGLRTREATFFAMISGILLTSARYGYNKIDHYDHFMVTYIPFIMLFYDWAKTYSLDALIRQKRGQTLPEPNTSNWQDAWPLLAILLLTATLFTWAGLLKLFPDRGSWLWNYDIIRKVTYNYNQGIHPNPFAFVIVDNLLIYGSLRFLAVGFETSFFLSVFSRSFRTFFICSAVLFHLYNLTVNGITFIAMLIVYAVFIDWQGLYARWFPSELKRAFRRVPLFACICISLVSMLVISLSWGTSFDSLPRMILRVIPPGLVWVIAGTIAVYGVVTSGWHILRDGVGFIRGRRAVKLEGV